MIFRAFSALAAMALGATVVLAWPGFSPMVEAGTGTHSPAVNHLDNRLLGTACSQHAWPYFEPRCLHDTRQDSGEARNVRMVTTDKVEHSFDLAGK